MFTTLASFLASGLLAFASLNTSAPEASVSNSVELPATFEFVGVSAEENARLNDGARCNPRSVINSVPELRACLLAGRLPGCDIDFDADDVSVCPDGSLRFRVIIYNDCPGAVEVPIAEFFVCNCAVESWTCF